MQYADTIVKQFLQYSQRNGGDNKGFAFQDPTYIGFYFYIDVMSTKNSNQITDYTYEYAVDGLFRPIEDKNSAAYYLKSRGEHKRADMIIEFGKQFLELVNNNPWFLQSVSGVGELWKFDPKISFRAKDKKLTFTTLESIDLKITYLLDLYRKATFDTQYMRYMLPENLRYFNAELVVAEIRNLHTLNSADNPSKDPNNESLTNRFSNGTLEKTVQGLAKGDSAKDLAGAMVDNGKSAWNDKTKSLKSMLLGSPSSTAGDYPITLSSFNNLATFMSFSLKNCEFSVYDEAPKFLDTLSSTANEMAANGFSIKINNIVETNTYGLLGAVLKDTLYKQQRDEKSSEIIVPGSVTNAELPQNAIADYTVKTKIGGDNSRQLTRQKDLAKEQGKSIFGNGLAGQLAKGAVTNAATKGKEATIGAARNDGLTSVLGNVYGSSPGTSLSSLSTGNILQSAQNLLSKSTSPALAETLLRNVTLESPMVSNTISPASIDGSPLAFSDINTVASSNLTGVLGSTSGDTDAGGSAVFAITGIAASANLLGNPGSVPLIGPSSSSSLPSNVGLNAPIISSATPGNVVLDGIGSLTGNPGFTQLEGSGQLEGSPGTTQLTGIGSLTGNPGFTQLEGIGQLEGSPGSVDLTGIGQIEGNPGNTQLTGIGEIDGNPGKTILDSPNINIIGNTGHTELTGIGQLVGNIGKETLTSTNTILEGNPGKTQLDGKATLEGEMGSILLEGTGKLEGSLTSVLFTGSGSLTGDAGKTTLTAAPVAEGKLSQVILDGSGDLEGNPGSITFTDNNAKLEGSMGKVILTGSADLIPNGMGKVKLNGQSRLEANPGSVTFNDAGGKLEGNIGKEEMIAPKVEQSETKGNVNLTGPTTNLTSDGLGNSNPSGNTNPSQNTSE